jgi:hypothetical protein
MVRRIGWASLVFCVALACGGDEDCDDGVCDTEQRIAFIDACDDAEDIAFYFHSLDRNVSWPAAEPDLSDGYEVSTERAIECWLDEWICLGAQAGPHVWGVGLDRSDACEDDWCCLQCSRAPVSLGRLTCENSDLEHPAR